uniref:Chitin-binding type-2 domain-containing protein n=1 Tax=Anopheles maculatus TaxID=74869 RepID=A0A182S7A5_9DIPT
MRLTVALGVALLAIIGTATAKPSSAGSCSKQEEGATYGIVGDCQKYLVCKKGSLEIKECKSKTDYDTVSGKCVKAGSATCAVETSPEPEPEPEPVPEPEPEESPEQYDYLCQKVLYGVRVHPNACDRYLVCSKEKAAIERCAEGFIFVADFISCVPGNKDTCTVQSAEPSTTESVPSGSDESGESKESGSDEKPSSEATGSGEESSEAPEDTTGPYDYLCAKTLLGSVAHPESCKKYISCYKYKGKEESCKKGYAYSSTLHLCVKQKNGGCADAPEEQPTTEAA